MSDISIKYRIFAKTIKLMDRRDFVHELYQVNSQKLYDNEKDAFLPYGNDGCADPFGTVYL